MASNIWELEEHFFKSAKLYPAIGESVVKALRKLADTERPEACIFTNGQRQINHQQ